MFLFDPNEHDSLERGYPQSLTIKTKGHVNYLHSFCFFCFGRYYYSDNEFFSAFITSFLIYFRLEKNEKPSLN